MHKMGPWGFKHYIYVYVKIPVLLEKCQKAQIPCIPQNIDVTILNEVVQMYKKIGPSLVRVPVDP